MSRYGIIAIGYNRPGSMQRLLKKLAMVDYKGDNMLLIISVDSSGTNDVKEVAESFEWKYGNKIVKTYEEKLGLRRHVLMCGTYMEEYHLDAVAVFEDDIIPSPAFYNYMRQAVEFYKEDNNIAGISLYTHLFNVNAKLPFIPSRREGDVYFSSFAQSWGQIWMRKQWKEFEQWYYKLPNGICPEERMPDNVISWPETSWLKYHISYCIQNKKYFVYPYEALATCYTDAGVHSNRHITLFQVPMTYNSNKEYQFVQLEKSEIRYDCFFEREGLGKYLNLNEEELCVDIYGTKKSVLQRYWLTTKIAPFFCIRKFSLELRPHEENVCYGEDGNEIFLYDTQREKDGKRKIRKKNLLEYYYRLNISGRKLVTVVMEQKCRSIWEKIKRK